MDVPDVWLEIAEHVSGDQYVREAVLLDECVILDRTVICPIPDTRVERSLAVWRLEELRYRQETASTDAVELTAGKVHTVILHVRLEGQQITTIPEPRVALGLSLPHDTVPVQATVDDRDVKELLVPTDKHVVLFEVTGVGGHQTRVVDPFPSHIGRIIESELGDTAPRIRYGSGQDTGLAAVRRLYVEEPDRQPDIVLRPLADGHSRDGHESGSDARADITGQQRTTLPIGVVGDEGFALSVVVSSVELWPLILDGCFFFVICPDMISVRNGSAPCFSRQ